jgi:glycosyltransferase involved in cell wall biosynthesis
MSEIETQASADGVAHHHKADGPLFSVIIPTFDRPALLAAAVESVLGQGLATFECIVVDDGGLQPADLPDDSRIRFLRREHSGGAAAARNTGLDAARGEYVTFLDDDDTYTADRLSRAVDALATHPVAICWRNGGQRQLEGNVADVILNELVPHVGQVSLHRDAAPRFDEEFRGSEDVEWWLRLAQEHLVTTVPEVGYLYRSHSGPRHRNGLEARIEGLELLLGRHKAYFDSHPRARAFQMKQIGLAQLGLGNAGLARKAFWASLRARPEARTAWHLVRSTIRVRRDSG